VRASACVLTRGRLDAALAPLVAAPTTPWKMVTVAPWYGHTACHVHSSSATAVRYHSGWPPVPIRWVLIRDPAGTFAPQALLSTTLERAPVQLLTWFVQRWPLETTVAEARAYRGIATSRQWSDRSVARPPTSVFGLYSVMTLMAAPLIGAKHAPVRTAAWDPT
jgi:hypothetical protein